ncbi:hypothetical protein HMPREF0105_1241 [Bacteroides sp. 3_1_33FAA]|uniref:Uncharacterized protein n=1 Tax=Phocaeicola dorei DSM 17855 TaxID=483217 RepID=B6VUL6_9BACT|nr:hypothetical protein BACDOR_00971 [Phocaeicola dorei DSM 17855]EEZ22044.1 hypothetical protein HMPREF0105_1241 [Bacteroides sp. 3_1_33FAA]
MRRFSFCFFRISGINPFFLIMLRSFFLMIKSFYAVMYYSFLQ